MVCHSLLTGLALLGAEPPPAPALGWGTEQGWGPGTPVLFKKMRLTSPARMTLTLLPLACLEKIPDEQDHIFGEYIS